MPPFCLPAQLDRSSVGIHSNGYGKEMTVVVCVADQQALDLLGNPPADVELITWDGGTDRPDRLAQTEFWVPQVDEALDLPEALRLMPALRVMQLTSAGIETVVGQVPESVTLCDGRGIHGGATSEWVLTAILSCQRRMPHFVEAQRAGHWARIRTDELQDKTVLVIGAGDLGEQTARRLRAFDAQPVMVARSARDGIRGTDELPELLPHADIVVVVIPQTPQTVGMIDADFLARMADGALLVNASRGPIVVTDALAAELHNGRLRAALDVTDPEPLPDGHPLWDAPNVLITPHIAGNVGSSARRAYQLVAEQLKRYCDGQDLINVVDGDY